MQSPVSIAIHKHHAELLSANIGISNVALSFFYNVVGLA